MSVVDLHGFLTYLIGCQVVTTEDLFASEASGQLGRGIWLAVSNMINTVMTNEIGDLEHQGVSVEERRQLLKKLEQEELGSQ
ncbi:hypothetical protein RHMOL_Rhmol06G0172000 [Rhododendron molle]|uniref:Uncharacterized protein n=1 Tax=Rhododendron molle TaxID=49168 RepID=A0ACC0NDU6_RHOML|nr:hypothetical protein RHMOL_Rhmol06G0172000 [Rhododendron molle]